MNELFKIIKKPLSRRIAAILEISYQQYRERVVSTKKGRDATGANRREPFEEEKLIDAACIALENQIKELQALKGQS